jgi:hypothetical protein
MFLAIKAWWARQWPQVSTKIGAALTIGSGIAGQLAPQLTTLDASWGDIATKTGAALGLALIIWNEKGGANA